MNKRNKPMFSHRFCRAALTGLFLLSVVGHAGPAAAIPPSTLKQWGREALAQTDGLLWIPERNLYAQEAAPENPLRRSPSFMWGCGVQLSALVAAAKLDRKTYAPRLDAYTDGLQVYWQTANGVGGYDVLPGPKGADRYYDDNEWLVLTFADAYDITHNARYRDRAEDTFRFVASGEDDVLGGGLYWHEQEKNTKNTCSNAPAIVGALRLYQITRKPEYLQTALRLYDWTNSHLQDTDGLYFDNVKLDGKIDRTKFSYNSALMIRANLLLYAIQRRPTYLQEAQRIARAGEAFWVHADTGAIRDGGAFAHLFTESLLFLYDADKDRQWLTVVHRALQYLHDNVRDPAGYYADHWDRTQTEPLAKVRLIDQASAVRALYHTARYPAPPKEKKESKEPEQDKTAPLGVQ